MEELTLWQENEFTMINLAAAAKTTQGEKEAEINGSWGKKRKINWSLALFSFHFSAFLSYGSYFFPSIILKLP